ncbi:uncharacterized transporter slc-17.2-like isoform X2 [Spodoptera litura]|uniref:Uncharacterized transporter slc-17.2-like isoform X2 n=1 Tax=Spodoptera litura TaxID=69820 RepID=A0A9J7ITT5_SPOLT|nr:uncharacterized transporter slc-17.2-like isoform X2 [Spodoptera litura]
MAEPTTVDKGSGIPVRFIVAIMMFFACGINYMMRVNVSVNIIAMVPRDITNKKQQSECESTQTNKSELMQPPGTPTFNWTNQEQAYVLGGYFWGYATSCVVGGTVAEQYGPRKVVFYTMIIAAILTGLTPPAAMISVQMLLASRVVGGLAAGFLFPSLHALLAHWAPPQEKSKFVSALLGGAIGTACTWSLSGPLIKALGWPYAFYIQGLIGITWCFVWLYLVHDSPRTHPRISKGEREYILNAIGDKIAHGQKVKTPFKKILTSFPYLAMVVLHYGNDWGIYFIMTAAPKFISGALGFDLSSVGGLSSLPYICRMCFALGFGYIGDSGTDQFLLGIKWCSLLNQPGEPSRPGAQLCWHIIRLGKWCRKYCWLHHTIGYCLLYKRRKRIRTMETSIPSRFFVVYFNGSLVHNIRYIRNTTLELSRKQ